MKILALVPNLLDRGRFAGVEGVVFVNSADALIQRRQDFDAFVVDLTSRGASEAILQLDGKRTYAFAGHVDEALLAAADSVEGVEALPRSLFFRRLPGLFS